MPRLSLLARDLSVFMWCCPVGIFVTASLSFDQLNLFMMFIKCNACSFQIRRHMLPLKDRTVLQQ